ncbi:hypothetical protein CerSpe_216720 [Prunus speciosa]
MALEDFESSFERQLDLSARERIGVVIDSSTVSDRFVGFPYSLVAKVISHQEVHRDNFIKTFTSLWRGTDEVSIKEIASNRFWVRFVSDRDYQLVLDMEPWTFRRSLVVLATVSDEDCIHTVPLTHVTFWVQIHGVPGFCMTVAVATAIGSTVGEVLRVDNRDGQDCVGRFIRVRVRSDIRLPLMRRTPVTFPEVGEKIIEFRYKYLPEYCFACGVLGHATQECVKKQEASYGKLNPEVLSHFVSAFEGLEGVINLWGKPIGSSARRLSSQHNVSSSIGKQNNGDGSWRRDEKGGRTSSGSQSWRSSRHESDEATATASSPYKHRQQRGALSRSPRIGTNVCYRNTDESRQCGKEHMVVGGTSLGLLEVVIPSISSTSPEFEAGPCLASELVSMEVGPLEDMPTVLMAPQLPKGISTSLTLDLNQTCHVEVDVDPVGSVLPCAHTGDETNAYIALNGDPFNFMPIIERTAGKVKGRGRGRPRRVGAVTTSLGVQGVAAPSSKRKRLVEAPLEESSCEHGRSDVPEKRRLCFTTSTEQAEETSHEGSPRSQC